MVSFISSRSNPQVMRCASLQEKKYRERLSSFTLDGVKLFKEAALSGMDITDVFIWEEKKELLLPIVEEVLGRERLEKIGVFVLATPCFEKISAEIAPQGIITVIKDLDFFQRCIKINKESISKDEALLALDGVRDPGNLGAVIRSAAAFSINTVLLSADTADLTNPKTLRGAMGAIFKLRFLRVEDLEGSVLSLKEAGRRVFAAELREGAEALFDVKPTLRDVFVVGNEGHGIRPSVSAVCNGSVYIPISEKTESLNASVAASILLWEQHRSALL